MGSPRQAYNLVQPPQDFKDLIAAGVLVLLTAVVVALYLHRQKYASLLKPRNLLMVGLTFVFFLFAARLIIPNRTVVPYLFPIAAFSLTISALFSLEIGIVLSLALSI